MKTWTGLCAAASCLLTLVAVPGASAQDAVQVAPEHYRVLLDNDRVRVLEYHSRPGEKTPMHSHPDYVVYDLEPGQIKFTFPDGRTYTDENPEVGEADFLKARSHAQENVGSTEARALIIELKEMPMEGEHEQQGATGEGAAGGHGGHGGHPAGCGGARAPDTTADPAGPR